MTMYLSQFVVTEIFSISYLTWNAVAGSYDFKRNCN